MTAKESTLNTPETPAQTIKLALILADAILHTAYFISEDFS